MVASAYTPFDVNTRDRVVGFFVIGALLLFLIGFLIPFIQKLSAEDGVPFYTVLDQTYGIAPEATVALRGVVVGNVTAVSITTDGMVRVDMRLSPDYQQFYNNKSRMTVDTNITASTLLTGSGLVLVPGDQSNGPMETGQFIPTQAPQGIATLMEELDLVAITDQVTDIISNIENVTTGVADNQETLYSSLNNLEQVTKDLAVITQEVPSMMAAVDESLVALQRSTAGLDRIVSNSEQDLSAALKNTVTMTEQASITLAETELLFKATTPVMTQLPTLLLTTDVALQSITELSDQMATSWLFGGSKGSTEAVVQPTGVQAHPYDDTVYSFGDAVEATDQQRP